MNRRYWPTALGLLAAATLGWYLLYTELLVREMRRGAVVHSRIYVSILRGLNDPAEDAAERTLLLLSDEVQSLGIPLVVTDMEGIPSGAVNLPFEGDARDPADHERIREYARELARRNEPIVDPLTGVIFFGDPPLVRRLRWIPWLQVGALTGLLMAAAWMIRHNWRTERERIWAAMARESAHQMATPLSSLSGWVEILRLPSSERDGMATLPGVAAEMEADLERLEKVSHRFEWIGRPVRREAVDVRALLRGLERYIRVRLPQFGRGVEIQVEVDAGIPPALGNAILLEWALENLVKNALDALAGTGGTIWVHAEEYSPRRVAIRVSDDGPGVAPTIRKRIFEPGITTKKSGWGVGLSLARRIVQDVHAGRLLLEPSERGATFLVLLPIAPPAER
ncbi:MAG: HAMP domain-containing histidine kinase [Gemmatimonadota bacterium]|nr:HAMP domain-containing histidine kinase [Gemmatimonadota bacterium]